MPDNAEVVVVATITPISEHRDQVRDALAQAIPRVHAEDDGCLLYALHESPDGFVMIEKWRTADALAAHGKSPALLEMRAILDGKVAGPPDVKLFTAIPAGTPEQGQV